MSRCIYYGGSQTDSAHTSPSPHYHVSGPDAPAVGTGGCMGGGPMPGLIIMGGIPGLMMFPPPMKGGGGMGPPERGVGPRGAAEELGTG